MASLQLDAALIRERVVDLAGKRIRLANLVDTLQERDLTKRPTCGGFGRTHHFYRHLDDRWPENPLPQDPACKALGLPRQDMMRAHVFQIAACNSHCWYCFVPTDLLDGEHERSAWLSAEQMLDLFMKEDGRPCIIDLSGGEPGLAPEWVLWMMRALRASRQESTVYLWSDDNLTCDFFWTALSNDDRAFICSYRQYGKVACLKGYSSGSASFNTGLGRDVFQLQYENLRRYLTLPLDLYVYVTFTTPSIDHVEEEIRCFVDRLQELDPNLPLRMVPLLIKNYTPTQLRLTDECRAAFANQFVAARCWQSELAERFSQLDLAKNITDISLRSGDR
jgi:uncharacterized Fe-S cluster-containing radical SAM superfamily protein